MPKVTLAGHALHPMLVVALAALIPFSFVLDTLYRPTGKKSYASATFYGMVGAALDGLATGVGRSDRLPQYSFPLPCQTNSQSARSAQRQHARLTGLNILSRRKSRNHEGGSLLLSLLSTLGVITSGWFGGRMVYEQGMRVEGVSPVEGASEVRLPVDRCIVRGFQRLEEIAPSGDPTPSE